MVTGTALMATRGGRRRLQVQAVILLNIQEARHLVHQAILRRATRGKDLILMAIDHWTTCSVETLDETEVAAGMVKKTIPSLYQRFLP